MIANPTLLVRRVSHQNGNTLTNGHLLLGNWLTHNYSAAWMYFSEISLCLWWNNVFITVESQPLSCSKPVILTCLCLILRTFLMPLGCSCLNPHGQTASQSENMARCSKREKGAHWTKRRVIKEQHSILQCHDWVEKKHRLELKVWTCRVKMLCSLAKKLNFDMI